MAAMSSATAGVAALRTPCINPKHGPVHRGSAEMTAWSISSVAAFRSSTRPSSALIAARTKSGSKKSSSSAARRVFCSIAATPAVSTRSQLIEVVREASASKLKAGKWLSRKYEGVSLVDKTIAIMGFGIVGSEVARQAKDLGMVVIAHDPYASPDGAVAAGVELVSFDDVLARADFISLTPTRYKIFNEESFAKCKKGTRIVYVATGCLFHEESLVHALDSQGALDPFIVEPSEKESKLVRHEDVVVPLHPGASTQEAQEGVAVEIAEAGAGALQGELAATAVNAPMVAPAEVLAESAPYGTLAESSGKRWAQFSGEVHTKVSSGTPKNKMGYRTFD